MLTSARIHQRLLNGGVQTLAGEYPLGMKSLGLNAKYQGHSYPVELNLKGEKNLNSFDP
jgi:hypothetical protein